MQMVVVEELMEKEIPAEKLPPNRTPGMSATTSIMATVKKKELVRVEIDALVTLALKKMTKMLNQ